MKKKKDLRVIKTQTILYNTLLELLKEQPFEKIKVSNICQRARINRSTFYSHYNDKYELMVDFMNNLKESLKEELKKNNYSPNTRDYYIKMIGLLLNHIEEKKDVYQFALVNNENSIIIEMIENTIIDDITRSIEENNYNGNFKIPTEIISKFYIGGVIIVGASWLKGNIKYSKNQLIEYFDKLIPDNFK